MYINCIHTCTCIYTILCVHVHVRSLNYMCKYIIYTVDIVIYVENNKFALRCQGYLFLYTHLCLYIKRRLSISLVCVLYLRHESNSEYKDNLDYKCGTSMNTLSFSCLEWFAAWPGLSQLVKWPCSGSELSAVVWWISTEAIESFRPGTITTITLLQMASGVSSHMYISYSTYIYMCKIS